MIDTIGVRFEAEIPEKQLKKWICTEVIVPGGPASREYKLDLVTARGANIRLMYAPAGKKYKKPSIRVTCSLPKVLYGSNIHMILGDDDIKLAIQKISNKLNASYKVPELDISQGYLYRIDFCYNHQVGELINDYIQALFHITYPKRSTKPYHPHEGVQFYSKPTTTSFYNKFEESGKDEAAGILRQETSLRRGQNIKRQLNSENAVLLKDITVQMATTILQKDLKVLGIDNQVITSVPDAFVRLVEVHGTTKAYKLIGYMAARSVCTTDYIVRHGSNKRTSRRYEKDIRQAGITIPLLNKFLMLPALKISLDNPDPHA